jgi:hypothetical protein
MSPAAAKSTPSVVQVPLFTLEAMLALESSSSSKIDCWGKGFRVCFEHLRILNFALDFFVCCGACLYRMSSCTVFFGPYTICFGVAYICTLTHALSSTLCHVLSIYVASKMTNSNLFQIIQNFPKIQNLANFGILANLAFWPILAIFGKIWISCSLHKGYTYRVQKSDLDDSVEGTNKPCS